MNLKDWLLENKISQAEFARRTDMNTNHLCHILQGKHFPRKRIMMKILKATEGKVTFQDMCEIYTREEKKYEKKAVSKQKGAKK